MTSLVTEELPIGPAAAIARPHDAAPAWIDRGRVPGLDGLRAVSIALVLTQHAYLASWLESKNAAGRVFDDLGTLGVEMFFAISGFLITLLLIREWRVSGGVRLWGFYLRRCLRLMPALSVFVATIFLLQRLGVIASADGARWMHVLTYTVNFDADRGWYTGHLWSLSIEEQFYLVWPLCFALLGSRPLRRLPMAWLVLMPLVLAVMLLLHIGTRGEYEDWTPFRLDSIAAGCLLAFLAQDDGFRRRTRVTPVTSDALVATFVLLLAANGVLGSRIAGYELVLSHGLRAVCVGAVIWLSANAPESVVGRLFEARPMIALGVLSYSLYLWQELFLVRHAGHRPLTLGACLLVSIGAAGASYGLIERPFLKLKGGWRAAARPYAAATCP